MNTCFWSHKWNKWTVKGRWDVLLGVNIDGSRRQVGEQIKYERVCDRCGKVDIKISRINFSNNC
jgi:hypothetical protein